MSVDTFLTVVAVAAALLSSVVALWAVRKRVKLDDQ